MKFYNEYQVRSDNKSGKLKILNNFNNGLVKVGDQYFIINNLSDLNRSLDSNTVSVIEKSNYILSAKDLNEDILNYNLEEEILENYEDEVKNSSSIETELLNFKDNIKYGQVINCLSDNSNLFLTGVLKTNSKYSYGRTKKGVPIYLFIPNNSIYPPFYVASNYKKKNQNINNLYVYIKYKEWDLNSKYPTGTCETIIGEIGNQSSEYLSLLYQYKVNLKNYKLNPKIYLTEENYHNYDKINNRLNETDQNLFSIDPPNCQDIDDVIGIIRNQSGFIISVHIADVTNFVQQNDEIDQLAKIKGTSVYSPLKQYNMLPDYLSCDICSLLPNKIRFTICLKIIVDHNFSILQTNISMSLIKSNFALDYDTASKLLDNKNYKNIYPDWLNRDLNLLSQFVKHNNILNKSLFDSHSIIDTLMVITNSEIAKKLYEYDTKSSLLRIHLNNNIDINGNHQYLKVENRNSNYQKFQEFMHIYDQNSADYIVSNQIELDKVYHHGLNIKFYTHFTSPIRRYFDMMVHRQIKNIYFHQDVQAPNLEELNIQCINLNIINEKVKKCERDSCKITILFDSKIDKNNLECYIINFNQFYKLIQIYIPKLNMTHTFKPLSKKLNNLLEYIFNNNQMTIKNIHTYKKITFNKFQLIKISIIPDLNKEFKYKSNVKIIEPNINEII